ncbi:MAG: polysaccharide biosynthesis/export family protein [Hyphomicrobiaceae bacterium]
MDIAGAERINIKFQGQPELSGDYRVNDDQTISVPVVGRMSIARLDAAALELALADRVSRLTGREAYVTVEVAEYRPVFVSGYVSRPGTAPWKPGLTVLQAITIAGGDFRSSASGGDNFSLRVQRAVDDQKRIFAQVARLEAERAGATKIAIPERLVARVGTQQAKELIDAQNSVFASRRSASDAQIAGLERAIDLTKTEFEGMSSQKKRLAEQLDARRGQLARLKSVYDKGLLRNDRLVDEQIKMADLEEKIASVGVSTARASSTLVGLERELANARQDRNAAIDAELLKLERDVAQLDLEIQSLGVTSSKPILTSTSKDGKDGKDSVIYEIVRQDRTGPRTIVADRYSLLRPGDMVVVSMKQ